MTPYQQSTLLTKLDTIRKELESVINTLYELEGFSESTTEVCTAAQSIDYAYSLIRGTNDK